MKNVLNLNFKRLENVSLPIRKLLTIRVFKLKAVDMRSLRQIYGKTMYS